jgi:hypothetical protein
MFAIMGRKVKILSCRKMEKWTKEPDYCYVTTTDNAVPYCATYLTSPQYFFHLVSNILWITLFCNMTNICPLPHGGRQVPYSHKISKLMSLEFNLHLISSGM